MDRTEDIAVDPAATKAWGRRQVRVAKANVERAMERVRRRRESDLHAADP